MSFITCVYCFAGDAETYHRSGAVEQLRVHVRNLSLLVKDGGATGSVELYERGYGKDAAGIAKEAIGYGMS